MNNNYYPEQVYSSHKEYLDTISCCKNLKPGDEITAERSWLRGAIVKRIEMRKNKYHHDQIPYIIYYPSSTSSSEGIWDLTLPPKLIKIIKKGSSNE